MENNIRENKEVTKTNDETRPSRAQIPSRAQNLIKRFEELEVTPKSSKASETSNASDTSESVIDRSNKAKFDKFKKSFDGSNSVKSRLASNIRNFKKFFEGTKGVEEVDESPRFDESEKFDTRKLKSVSKTGNHELLTLGNDLYYKNRKQPNTYSLIYSSKSGSDTKSKVSKIRDFLKKNPNGANYLMARSSQTVTVNKANDPKNLKTSKGLKDSKDSKDSKDLLKGVGSKVKNKSKMLQLLKRS